MPSLGVGLAGLLAMPLLVIKATSMLACFIPACKLVVIRTISSGRPGEILGDYVSGRHFTTLPGFCTALFPRIHRMCSLKSICPSMSTKSPMNRSACYPNILCRQAMLSLHRLSCNIGLPQSPPRPFHFSNIHARKPITAYCATLSVGKLNESRNRYPIGKFIVTRAVPAGAKNQCW